MLKSFLLLVAIMLTSVGLAFGLEVPQPENVAVYEQIIAFVHNLLPVGVANFLLSLMLIMASLRFVFKPVMSVLETFVLSTETKRDDEVVAAIKNSKIYQILVFLADFLGSIKLPKKREKK